jgi:proteasome assembly chaperone (PAC2) family protein
MGPYCRCESGKEGSYSRDVLNVDRWPELRDPVLVLVLSGWVDAGLAGAGAVSIMIEQLASGRRFAQLDLHDLADLQQTRPNVRLLDGVTRTIDWPTIDFVGGSLGRDVVVCTGPEPSIRWREVTQEIVGAAQRLGVKKAIGLGGIPMPVSHRRPMSVLVTATSHSLLQEAGPDVTRPDYTGPTGLQTVVQLALGEAGIPTYGLWAQVPHYVSGSASPPAIRALVEKACELGRLTVDLSVLDEQCDQYEQRVDESLRERPDVEAMLQAFESNTEPPPSGDELVAEIERFLRDQP